MNMTLADYGENSNHNFTHKTKGLKQVVGNLLVKKARSGGEEIGEVSFFPSK